MKKMFFLMGLSLFAATQTLFAAATHTPSNQCLHNLPHKVNSNNCNYNVPSNQQSNLCNYKVPGKSQSHQCNYNMHRSPSHNCNYNVPSRPRSNNNCNYNVPSGPKTNPCHYKMPSRSPTNTSANISTCTQANTGSNRMPTCSQPQAKCGCSNCPCNPCKCPPQCGPGNCLCPSSNENQNVQNNQNMTPPLGGCPCKPKEPQIPTQPTPNPRLQAFYA